MTRIAVSSEMAIVAVSDPSVPLPSGTDPEALIRVLEPVSQASQVFYLVTDDPVQCRLDILVNEQPTAEIGREFEATGGSFGLRLPSGRLSVSGWDHPVWALQPAEAQS